MIWSLFCEQRFVRRCPGLCKGKACAFENAGFSICRPLSLQELAAMLKEKQHALGLAPNPLQGNDLLLYAQVQRTG